MAIQKLDEENQIEMFPALEGADTYIALPKIGQNWSAALFDQSNNKWRRPNVQEIQILIQVLGNIPEVQRLAQQMGYQGNRGGY